MTVDRAAMAKQLGEMWDALDPDWKDEPHDDLGHNKGFTPPVPRAGHWPNERNSQ